MFLTRKFGTKSGATVSGAYQSQLRNVFAAVKITIYVNSLPQVNNSYLFNSFKPLSILKLAVIRQF